jgi:hypothetical protein
MRAELLSYGRRNFDQTKVTKPNIGTGAKTRLIRVCLLGKELASIPKPGMNFQETKSVARWKKFSRQLFIVRVGLAGLLVNHRHESNH